MTTKKTGCYVVYNPAQLRGYVGMSHEFPHLQYQADTRDAAGSGIRRMVKAEKTRLQKTMSGPIQTKRRKVNRVAIMVDRSGSMLGLTERAVEVLNQNIETLKRKSREEGQLTTVSIASFDDTIEMVVHDTLVENVPKLSTFPFEHRGWTALLDATASGIRNLENVPEKQGDDVAYLLIVITDGKENHSQISAEKLKQMIGRVQGTDRWTCTFLLPPGEKKAFCESFQIPAGNCAEWETTVAGISRYGTQLDTAISSYLKGRTLGMTSTRSFYTDLSKVTSTEIKNRLNDIGAQVKVWNVDQETPIRDFVESKLRGQPMLRGAAFYQLTKDEKLIQSYKRILIKEKRKGGIYEGAQARQMLGLPATGDVEVKPGDHGPFDVFVQSTSTNRKLVRGTQVVYWPAIGVPFTEGPSSVRARSRR